jgi:hypothetical protein
MKSIIVFNDSHQSDGFEKAVGLINELVADKINYVFLEDFVSDEGEYAFHVWITEEN